MCKSCNPQPKVKKESRAREVIENWQNMCRKHGCPIEMELEAHELLVAYIEGSYEETGELECLQQQHQLGQ